MTENICLDGIQIALDIKARCKKLRRTIPSIFREADVSYRNYTAWRSGQNNPSFAKLKTVYAVLELHELN